LLELRIHVKQHSRDVEPAFERARVRYRVGAVSEWLLLEELDDTGRPIITLEVSNSTVPPGDSPSKEEQDKGSHEVDEAGLPGSGAEESIEASQENGLSTQDQQLPSASIEELRRFDITGEFPITYL
jgi:hypothetical protein